MQQIAVLFGILGVGLLHAGDVCLRQPQEESEHTLVFLKPDALLRGLVLFALMCLLCQVGRILDRFETKGLMITGLKMIHPNTTLLKECVPSRNTKMQGTTRNTKTRLFSASSSSTHPPDLSWQW